MSGHLENDDVVLHVTQQPNGMLFIQGKLSKASRYDERTLMAANPIDRMMNYSGSGLAFTNPEIAFENTPNLYLIPDDGRIYTTFSFPNSYYTKDTLNRVPPSIFIVLKKVNEPTLYYQVKLEQPLPLKTSTTYRPEHDQKGPMFYTEKEIVMGVPPSQEWILRNIGDYKERYGIA